MKIVACLVLCLLAGCSNKKESAESTKVQGLLARSDVTIEKKFYPDSTVKDTPPADEIKGSILSHWTPGGLHMEPQTLQEFGKPSSRIKAAFFELTERKWTISGYGPAESSHDVSDNCALDEDELSDLEAALGQMESSEDAWHTKAPEVHTEIVFIAKDRMHVSLVQGSPSAYAVKIGAATVGFNRSQIESFRANLQKAIATLKEN